MSRIFDLDSVTLELHRLNLTQGAGAVYLGNTFGGLIHSYCSNITLVNCTLSHSNARLGGAIGSFARLSVRESAPAPVTHNPCSAILEENSVREDSIRGAPSEAAAEDSYTAQLLSRFSYGSGGKVSGDI